MGTLRIDVGDLHFSARWEAAAPATVEAIRRMSADRSGSSMPVVGESCASRSGKFRTTGHRLREPHPIVHPAPGMLAMLPAVRASARTVFPIWGVHDLIEGQAAGANHFASIIPDEGCGGSATGDGTPDVEGGRPGRPDQRGRRLRRRRRPKSGPGRRQSDAYPVGGAIPRRAARRQGDRPAMTDVVVRGGTVVAANGSSVADIAIERGLSGPSSRTFPVPPRAPTG